jgi:hypothetical protein
MNHGSSSCHSEIGRSEIAFGRRSIGSLLEGIDFHFLRATLHLVTAEGPTFRAAFLPSFEEVGAYEDALPEVPDERLRPIELTSSSSMDSPVAWLMSFPVSMAAP